MFMSKSAGIAGVIVLCAAGCSSGTSTLIDAPDESPARMAKTIIPGDCQTAEPHCEGDCAFGSAARATPDPVRLVRLGDGQCEDGVTLTGELPAAEAAAAAPEAASPDSKSQSQANSGRGNGSEGADPGKSGGKNKGGDED